MISMSDNNACDILIDFAGGIRSVDRYIRSLGITDFRLSVDERCMHRDIRDCYRNNSTPAETVRLLQKAYEQRLFRPAYHDLLWEAMRATSTGADKLKGRLPAEAAVAHKDGLVGSNGLGHQDRRQRCWDSISARRTPILHRRIRRGFAPLRQRECRDNRRYITHGIRRRDRRRGRGASRRVFLPICMSLRATTTTR